MRYTSKPWYWIPLQVPEDASVMDMVFADTGEMHGGFVDDNRGLDYHVPVAGSTCGAQRLKIVHVTVEMAPVAKVSLRPPQLCKLMRALKNVQPVNVLKASRLVYCVLAGRASASPFLPVADSPFY